jgi:hypothetical protein
MHNSNYQTQQITSGEILEEEKLHVLGFVSAEVVHLKKEVWFYRLNSEQISKVDDYLNKRASNFA